MRTGVLANLLASGANQHVSARIRATPTRMCTTVYKLLLTMYLVLPYFSVIRVLSLNGLNTDRMGIEKPIQDW